MTENNEFLTKTGRLLGVLSSQTDFPRLSKQEAKLLRLIHNNPGIVRTQLCRELDLSQASLTQILRRLFSNGILQEAGKAESLGGRRATTLALSPALVAVRVNENTVLGADLSPIDPDVKTRFGTLESDKLSTAHALAATRLPEKPPEVFICVSNRFSVAVKNGDYVVTLHSLEKLFPDLRGLYDSKIDLEFIQKCINDGVDANFENAKSTGKTKLLRQFDKNSNLIGKFAASIINLFNANSANLFIYDEIFLFDENRIKTVIQMKSANTLKPDFVLNILPLHKSEIMQGIAHITIDDFLKSIEKSTPSS